MSSSLSRDQLKTVLASSISALCRSHVQAHSGFSVEALIGVTVFDTKEVILININESTGCQQKQHALQAEQNQQKTAKRLEQTEQSDSGDDSSCSSTQVQGSKRKCSKDSPVIAKIPKIKPEPTDMCLDDWSMGDEDQKWEEQGVGPPGDNSMDTLTAIPTATPKSSTNRTSSGKQQPDGGAPIPLAFLTNFHNKESFDLGALGMSPGVSGLSSLSAAGQTPEENNSRIEKSADQQEHYQPKSGAKIMRTDFKILQAAETPPTGYQLLVEGMPLAVPTNWYDKIMSKLKKTDPNRGIKRLMECFMEPWEYGIYGGRSRLAENLQWKVILDALEVYALQSLKMDSATFTQAINEKMASGRNIMKARGQQQ